MGALREGILAECVLRQNPLRELRISRLDVGLLWPVGQRKGLTMDPMLPLLSTECVQSRHFSRRVPPSYNILEVP